VAPQPGLQKASLIGRVKRHQGCSIQVEAVGIPLHGVLKRSQCQVEQLLHFIGLLLQPFGRRGDASRCAGVKRFQHRQHFSAHAIATEACIGVAGVDPDRQPPLLAKARGVLAAEQEQRAH
jgi:hypothetical protein